MRALNHTMKKTILGHGELYMVSFVFMIPRTDDYRRFGWANGMFGQMILDIEARMPHLLEDSYQ